MYLSGYKNLELIAKMYKNIQKARIDEVVKIVGLQERIKDKVSKYSLGMRQRLGIAQAILHKPNVLILDEPTNGLDPEGIRELRELLQKLAQEEKMAILISSHNLAELESFCIKVCIIKNGEVIETEEIQKLKEETKEDYTIFKINNTDSINKVIENAEILNSTEFKVLTQEGEVPNIVKKLVESNIKIYRIVEETITLEDAFLKKTGGNKIV